MLCGGLALAGVAGLIFAFFAQPPQIAYVAYGATGFLDSVSYMSASLASTVFANAVSAIGWDGLILVWFGLMAIGVVIALPFKGGKTHVE